VSDQYAETRRVVLAERVHARDGDGDSLDDVDDARG
jgi:hypothetical protein